MRKITKDEQELKDMESSIGFYKEPENEPVFAKEKSVKQLETELKEMEKSLPVARYDKSLDEVVNLNPKERKEFNSFFNKKWIWKDSGKQVYDISRKDLLLLVEEGEILEMESKPEEDYIGEDKMKPGWTGLWK